MCILKQRLLITSLYAVLIFFVYESRCNHCLFDWQCYSNQICYQGECKCQMGFRGIPNGFGVECHEKFCSNRNDQCSQTFGAASCSFVDGYPRCVCDEDSVWNANMERCEHRKVISPSCATKTECGFRAQCYQRKCRCEFGYVWRMLPTYDGKLYKMICVPKSCIVDSECAEMFPNSKCELLSQKCVCSSKFYFNSTSQTCAR